MERFNAYELTKNIKIHETREYVEEFLNVLSTCHTVIPEKSADNVYNYQASSPDESAIIQSLEAFDVVFDSRTPSSIVVKFFGEERNFEVLNVLEFNSVRKRVSVILRDHNGCLKLYCKGADNVIIPRLSVEQRFKESTIEHLEEFAREGFRTLLVSFKILSEEAYTKWNAVYFEAATSLVDREKNLEKVAELIENEMILLGATAIEDKLQVGVPETIQMMKTAGIKVWVLTGDKIETAVNIGYSCRLLNEESYLIYLTSENIGVLRSTIAHHCCDYDDPNRLKVVLGLVTDANSVNLILNDKCSADFLKLAKNCDTVICCRATPKNKADIVEFIKSKTDCITLAVGDGANDVGMIQAAHVGVGIYGKEGLQALAASDYAIGQFRFLQKLLFVHGIWNYKRLCKVILYSFYKNICLYVIALWFAFSNGFSGQILFERWLIGLYNVLFTAAPPLALGLFDRPLQASTMLKNPKLYHLTQSKSDFNMKIFWAWFLNSLLHSILLYYICFGALQHDMAFSNGTVGGYLFRGNHVYTYCVIVVCLKSGLESESWTCMTFLSIFGSIAFWFVFLVAYSKVWPVVMIGADMSGMAVNLLQCAIFWLGLIFVPIFVLLPDVTYKTYVWLPTLTHFPFVSNNDF
jgi:phospholipid-transporting ATPase